MSQFQTTMARDAIVELGYDTLMKSAMNFLICMSAMILVAGCVDAPNPSSEVLVWGRKGLDDGRFLKPRAIAIDQDDHVFIVDMTGRIQVFGPQQNRLAGWRTPEIRMGKPCGMTVSNDNVLMVADTHYHRILFYDREGTLLEERTIGGVQGMGEGEFGYVTDIIQDSKNNYYVAEYGEFDRIQKFSPDGKFLFQWGGRGSEDGQFLRPQGLDIDEQDRIWVADASNHRIQVFDATGDSAVHIMTWGEHGRAPGQIRFPYDVVLEDEFVFVCEFGNHRVQKFTRDGQPLGMWGMPGREPGQMHQPWAMTIDSHDNMHVLDSYNHRVQTINYHDWHWPLQIDVEQGIEDDEE